MNTTPAPVRLVAAPEALRVELAKPPPELVGTGIAPLDAALNGGLGSCGVTYLAAGTGRGKTGLVIQIARAWLAAGRAVLFLETELTRRQVLARFLAQETGESWSVLHTYTPEQSADLFALADQKFPRLFVHEWRRGEDLLALVAALPTGIKRAVIVDQISDLARARATDRPDMRTATMQVSSELKQLALACGLPVLGVTPTSRGVTSTWNEGRKPRKGRDFESAAKDAGELEYDAEILLYLDSEPAKDGVASASLHIAKARHAASGQVIALRFHAALGLFVSSDAVSEESSEDARVLALVRERGPMGIGKLTKELHIGQPKVVASVDRLVAAGKVRKDSMRGVMAVPNGAAA